LHYAKWALASIVRGGPG